MLSRERRSKMSFDDLSRQEMIHTNDKIIHNIMKQDECRCNILNGVCIHRSHIKKVISKETGIFLRYVFLPCRGVCRYFERKVK
jgi:hypothetical protein